MEKYVPDIYQKSIYTIDYSKLLSRGIKCLLFDLDNTIIPPREKVMPQKAKDLFISLKQKGFKVIIFSNSPSFRTKPYKKFLDVDTYSNCHKPSDKKFKKVFKEYNFNLDEIAIIGDQLLTDIKGGNNVGITTVLVTPITKKDHLPSMFFRHIENRIMQKLRDKNLFSKERYYD